MKLLLLAPCKANDLTEKPFISQDDWDDYDDDEFASCHHFNLK